MLPLRDILILGNSAFYIAIVRSNEIHVEPALENSRGSGEFLTPLYYRRVDLSESLSTLNGNKVPT
jgi:hypothetical protein